MAKGSKRARGNPSEADLAEITAKRPAGVRPQEQPPAQEDAAEALDPPIRDRREIMADVARR